MSVLKSRVGPWKLNWKAIPRGNEGVTQVEVKEGQWVEVRWKKDQDGIWLLLPHGNFGFDLQREWDENGQVFYHVSQRGFHSEWKGIPFFRGNEGLQQTQRNAKGKATRVRSQMPGKIIRIMVEPGQVLEKGHPALVMEAMKMENEIRIPQAGRVSQIKVKEGQAVESGADLLLIEPVE